MIINVIQKEFREGNLAVRESIITLFNFPIFKRIETSTNNNIVRSLTVLQENKFNIKGFKNENENINREGKSERRVAQINQKG